MAINDTSKICGIALALVWSSACDGVHDSSSDPTNSDLDLAFDEARSPLEREDTPEVSAEQLEAMRNANTDLGFDLLQQLALENNDNLAVSALSIRAAFGMVYAMARGSTQDELASVLGFLEDSDATHRALNLLDLALDSRNLPASKEEDPVVYSMANRMFVLPRLPPGSSYLDTLALHYGAGIYLTDFGSEPESIRKKINKWVSERTRSKIPTLFPEGSIKPNTQWVLVNAVYLKAPWKTPFAEYSTSNRDFTTLNGTTIEVPTMHNEEFNGIYGKGDGYQFVDLALRDEKLSAVFILPDFGQYQTIESSLSSEFVDTMLATSNEGEIQVYLPKFTIETGSMSLVKPLKELGMRTAFGGEVDFSGYGDDGGTSLAEISKVYHSVFVAVDETGIEAAAATGIGGEESAADPVFTFDANRPFLFLVRDRPTGSVLFAGRVLNPN